MYLVDYQKIKKVADNTMYYDISNSTPLDNAKNFRPTRSMPILKVVQLPNQLAEIWTVANNEGGIYIFQGVQHRFSSVIPNLSTYNINVQIDELIDMSELDNKDCLFFNDVTQYDIANFLEWDIKVITTLSRLLYDKAYPLNTGG